MTPSTQTNQPHRSRNSHRRARYGETRTAGSGGDHAEKDPPTRAPRRVVDPTSRNSRPRSPPTARGRHLAVQRLLEIPRAREPRHLLHRIHQQRGTLRQPLPDPGQPGRSRGLLLPGGITLDPAILQIYQEPSVATPSGRPRAFDRKTRKGHLGPPTGDRQAHLLSTPLPLRRRRAHWSIPHRPLQAEPAGPCGRLGYPTPPDNPGHDGAHPADGRTVRQRCDGHRLLAPQREAVRNCSPLVFRC